jgi:serine/threonine-protein kinase RsbW
LAVHSAILPFLPVIVRKNQIEFSKPGTSQVIRIKLPCLLEYRDLAMRMVTSACRLVEIRHARRANGHGSIADDWGNQVISAFGEAFNNVVIHAYGSGGGDLEIEIEPDADRLTIRLMDYGKPFDPGVVAPPDLESLPESGLGIFIIRECMDDVTYEGGSPNVLSMTKYLVPHSV